MFASIGYANPNLELDLSTLNLTNIKTTSYIFDGMRSTTKIWVKDVANQTWVINHKGTGQLSTSNVLVK